MRRFPTLRPAREQRQPPEAIPWEVMEIVRAEAASEHSQTLEELAARGGLAWYEIGHLFVLHHDQELNPQSHGSAYSRFRLPSKVRE